MKMNKKRTAKYKKKKNREVNCIQSERKRIEFLWIWGAPITYDCIMCWCTFLSICWPLYMHLCVYYCGGTYSTHKIPLFNSENKIYINV